MSRWAVVVMLAGMLAGCGRIDFDERASDAAASDAPFPTGPFGPAQPILEVNTSFEEDDASMTDDLLELYFQTDRGGIEELWVATRPAADVPWGLPVPLDAVNAGGNVNNPKVTSDGLALVFASVRTPNAGGADIWLSTRPDRQSAWSAPAPIVELESTGDDYEPCLDRSQLHVYFTSDRASSTNADPWRASRASTAEPFGSIMLVPELASPLEDGTVWIHDAGLIALFHSYRNGMGSDLYQATRASVNDPFGNIAPIAGIMTGAREEDAWMSQDGHTLLFVSNVTGNRELYIATR